MEGRANKGNSNYAGASFNVVPPFKRTKKLNITGKKIPFYEKKLVM